VSPDPTSSSALDSAAPTMPSTDTRIPKYLCASALISQDSPHLFILILPSFSLFKPFFAGLAAILIELDTQLFSWPSPAHTALSSSSHLLGFDCAGFPIF
jgi:hypothetical protein